MPDVRIYLVSLYGPVNWQPYARPQLANGAHHPKIKPYSLRNLFVQLFVEVLLRPDRTDYHLVHETRSKERAALSLGVR
jgi:hypothetical protein